MSSTLMEAQDDRLERSRQIVSTSFGSGPRETRSQLMGKAAG